MLTDTEDDAERQHGRARWQSTVTTSSQTMFKSTHTEDDAERRLVRARARAVIFIV